MSGNIQLNEVADAGELERHSNALRKVFEDECVNQNDALSCHRLAEFYQSIEKNLDRATQLYKYVRALLETMANENKVKWQDCMPRYGQWFEVFW